MVLRSVEIWVRAFLASEQTEEIHIDAGGQCNNDRYARFVAGWIMGEL